MAGRKARTVDRDIAGVSTRRPATRRSCVRSIPSADHALHAHTAGSKQKGTLENDQEGGTDKLQMSTGPYVCPQHIAAARLTVFRTMATRCAKRHVEMDSSSWSCALLMVATMTVRQLPPSESFSAMVIMLLR